MKTRPTPEKHDKMKTIEQFCAEHSACLEGQKWALAHCKDMQEVWSTAKPTWLIWIATRPGVLTERELRLFTVSCARQVQHLLTDPRSVKAIDVAERYANGDATEEELAAARDEAWAAASDAASAAGMAAACAVACATDCAAARVAARDAARAAARAAAWAAASDAASDAVMDAAWDAARAAQAEWLRNNTQPNFL